MQKIYVPAASYIMTPNGWIFIPFKEKKEEILLSTFNINRKKLNIPRSQLIPVSEYRKKEIKRILFRINRTEVSAYYAGEFVERYPIFGNEYILEHSSNRSFHPKLIDIYMRYQTIEEIEAFFYLYGMVLTDGSIFKEQENTYEIYQGAENAKVCEKIINSFRTLDIKFPNVKTYNRKRNGKVHFTWRFTVRDNFFPFSREEIAAGTGWGFFSNVPKQILQIFIQAMIDADGSTKDSGTSGGFYKPVLIDFFRYIAYFLNLHTTMPTPERSTSDKDNHRSCSFSFIQSRKFLGKHDIYSESGYIFSLPINIGIMIRQAGYIFIV